MSSDHKKRKESPGERLLLSLFRLTGAVSLYNANNPRLFAIIDMFREAIDEIRAEAGVVAMRVHNSRFYLNRQLLSFSPAMLGPVSKMADYFHLRGVQGFKFLGTEQIWDDQVIAFVELLNRSEREKDPVAFLQASLRGDDYRWIELLVDQDSELGAQDPNQGPDAKDEEGKSPGRRSHALSVSAREAYSQALTVMLNTVGKLPTQKQMSIQRTKRVIQNMIDILAEDENILLGLGTIRDYDDYTYTHSVNVAILSMCLAKRLGLSRSIIEQVGLCGLFHDLGKVDVPVKLITKATRLTSAEYEEVKKHPIYSIRHIMRFTADHAMKAKFLLPPFEHHLGIDWSGYPQINYREPLSLLSRILSIADHYDALTSSRSYRPTPFSPDMALRIMVESSGSKLDPILLKVFIDMIGVYPVGSFVLLDTGEFGLVAEVPENAEFGRPVVALLVREGDAFVQGDRVDLSERRDDGAGFRRNIARSFHPSEYGIQPANFLV